MSGPSKRKSAVREARKIVSSVYRDWVHKDSNKCQEVENENHNLNSQLESASLSSTTFNAPINDTEGDEAIAESNRFDEVLIHENIPDAVLSSHSESHDSHESVTGNNNIRAKLSSWVIKHNISYEATNELLEILRSSHLEVPRDARTLRRTPKDAQKYVMGEGTYVHYGLKEALTDFFIGNNYNSEEVLIDVNIDGLPLCKSSNRQLWPILFNVVDTTEVHLIGVYEGYSKPNSSNAFLKYFIEDMQELATEGFFFERKKYNVKIRSFVCDAPARSFILKVKGHTGYYSCIKCTQKGEVFKNKLVFRPNEISELRTNESFRMRVNSEHHNQMSPIALESLDIDMVKQIALDYMHIVCLGVMKSLLHSWTKVKGENFSLSSWKIRELSEKLTSVRGSIPCEFVRKPRHMNDLDRWKASEFRQFLLYTGPFILKNILNEERYTHFLKLSLAIRILLQEENCILNNRCAEKLLRNFIEHVPTLYNLSLLTCNFHYLIHLHHHVLTLNCTLESTSAFKFENHLRKIKKMVKKSSDAAVQVYNREVERSLNLEKKCHTNFSLGNIHGNQYSKIRLKHFSLSTKSPNNFCVAKEKLVKVLNIFNINGIPRFKGIIINNLEKYFSSPIESSLINIYTTKNIMEGDSIVFAQKDILQKIVCLEDKINNIFFFIPFIHHSSRSAEDKD